MPSTWLDKKESYAIIKVRRPDGCRNLKAYEVSKSSKLVSRLVTTDGLLLFIMGFYVNH